MACYCIGGKNCCLRRQPYVPDFYWYIDKTPIPMAGPFRCPDCGTWWAGYEHVCPQAFTTTSTEVEIDTDEQR